MTRRDIKNWEEKRCKNKDKTGKEKEKCMQRRGGERYGKGVDGR